VSNSIEPKKSGTAANVDDVAFTEVDQPGPGSLFEQAKGFWVTFSSIFKKNLTVAYPEVKAPTEERTPPTQPSRRWFREMYWMRTLCMGMSCRCNLCRRCR
jgi:formate hydrogenlyase subunit 6/NADH:ubiquinone oxidoreductase subunit I